MEWLHPVTLEQKIAVNVKVAALIAVNLHTKSLHDFWFVQVLGNVSWSGIAKVARIFAFLPDIVDVLASALVWTYHCVVAIDGGWYTAPDALTIITALDERLATRQGVVHRLALALAEDTRPDTLTTSHRTIVCVLSETIREAVADEA